MPKTTPVVPPSVVFAPGYGNVRHLAKDMEHTFILKNPDLLKALFYVHIRNKFLWGLCIFPGSIIHMVGFVGLWAMGWPPAETAKAIAEFIVWVLALNMIGYIAMAIGMMLNPKWRKGRVGEHTVSFSDDGLVEETIYNQSQIKWPSISNIDKGRSLIYIPHAGGEIFAIPKHSFSNTEDWVNYSVKLKAAWQEGIANHA